MCTCARWCVRASTNQSQPDVSAVRLQGGSLFVHLQGLLVATRVVVQSSERSQDVHLPRHLQGSAGKGHTHGFTVLMAFLKVKVRLSLSRHGSHHKRNTEKMFYGWEFCIYVPTHYVSSEANRQ